MINLSIKVRYDYLLIINEINNSLSTQYLQYLQNNDPLEWIIEWKNFESFKLKIAKLLHEKRKFLITGKTFKISINANQFFSFKNYLMWSELNYSKIENPYTRMLIQDVFSQVKILLDKEGF